MNDAIQNVITKVRKLLNLAQSRGATEAEASLAAEHAQRLLEEYALTRAQVDGHDVDPLGRVTSGVHGSRKTVPTWVGWIATSVAATSYTFVLKGPAGSLQWIGTEPNVRASIALLDFLVQQCSQLRRDYRATSRIQGEDFVRGCASRVSRRLRDAYKERQAARNTAGETTALVVLDQQRNAVDRYVEQHVRHTKPRQDVRGTRDRSAYFDGQAAGNRVQINNRERVAARRTPSGLLA